MKRFTETTKWRDPWFRRLSPAAKLLWQYLTDNCSCIGLIDLDLEAACFDIGEAINEKHLTELSDRVQALSNGKYFIPKFIQFQYGDLSTACPAHKPILKAIDQHKLTIGQKGYQYPSDRVSDTLQEKEKEKDQEKDRSPTVQKTTPPSSEHVAFIDGWVQNFKAKFGFDYSFDGGRDGKAVRELLKMGVLRLDLLEIAKQAWDKSGKTPKFFNCDQSVTIHGFRNHFNQIRTEIKNGTQTPQRVNPRNIGISRPSTGGDYGEAAKRKLERQALEAQHRAASEAQGNGTPSGPVLHGDVGTPTGGQVAGSGGQ